MPRPNKRTIELMESALSTSETRALSECIEASGVIIEDMISALRDGRVLGDSPAAVELTKAVNSGGDKWRVRFRIEVEADR